MNAFKMKLKHRTIWALIWVLAMMLPACGDVDSSGVDKKASPKKIKQVKTRPIGASVPANDIQYVGTLIADRKVRVSAELGGTIEKIFFEKGDHVEEGQVLAEVGTRTIELQVKQAAASVEAARSRLKKLKTGSRPQEIEIARARVEEAKAALSEAEKNHERVSTLHKIGAVSNSQYDTSLRQLSTSRARLDSAKQQLVLSLEGPRKEDINAAVAGLKEAEASLALARDRLKKSRVHSPIAGIVAYRHVEAGEVIPAGAIITEVVDLKRMKITLSIGEKDIYLLNPDQSYTFTVDAIPREQYTARLLFRSPTGDTATRAFPVEFLVERPDEKMADGMTVRVMLPVVGRDQHVRVPSAWLAEQDGKIGVYVPDDGTARFKPVKLGNYYDQRVEIVEGLEGVSRVIINPSGLNDGDAVEVMKP
jgi:HlyD family secretion protein